MYYTGIDLFTKQEVYLARQLRDRKLQRELVQLFKPENYILVREALLKAGCGDLVGGDCDVLVPAQPPREAIQARRERADSAVRGEYVHTVPNPARPKGYRPRRSTARRRDRR
jgi:hypothetical protein